MKPFLLALILGFVASSAAAAQPMRQVYPTKRSTFQLANGRTILIIVNQPRIYGNSYPQQRDKTDHWDRLRSDYMQRTYGNPQMMTTPAPRPRTSTSSQQYYAPSRFTPPLRE